ncbi:Predicted membrane protein [Georgenia satyanarayanai]|uniref:Predicted membrane protein n=1 Tax=Georgenia satyanarayanai TaxID=860221 RepID=A0A2Y9AKY4_9MICO|nr:DUF2207 domain-containing protein [Georgenia satyanarayanai]PYF99327.1 putative membrane protein DUF2207 [Georgenia satyanarayanai]SSA43139.1 Predicted membrane protein [Georgenia satyanarayanai]
MTAARRTASLLVLALLGVAALTLLVAPPARADDSVGHIARLDVGAVVEADGGTVRVEVDLTYDFGDDEAHGPFLVLAELQEIADDPDRYRRLTVDDVTAESPTGAPADLRVEHDGGAVQLYIGDEDVEVTGVHDYRVTYTVDGLPTPRVAGEDGTVRDELYWNVVAPGGFDVPIEDVTVTVTGPVPPEASACYVGRTGSDTACDGAGETRGERVDFAQERLDEGEGLSVAVGWPAGTLVDAEPVYEPRRTWTNTMQLGPLTGGAAGAATVLGAGAAVVVASRRGRDKTYLALTPGLAPADGQAGTVGPVRRRQPVAVRFTPPDDVRPGEVGTLHDEVADPDDVSATLVDLAVRGYLRIEEVAPEKADDDVSDWRLVPLRDWAGEVEAYERALLDALLPDGEPVALSEVAEEYAAVVGATQEALYRTVTEHGWFAGDPSAVRNRWLVGGLGLVGLGVLVTLALVLLRWPAVLGVPLLVVGIVVAAASSAAPARTARGTAVLAQTLGFRQYLATAEAEQIRFEEGQDIFSRYLPYAIVFGLTERWAQILADVAAQGRHVESPGWYVPLAVGHGWWTQPAVFATSVGAFAAAASSAVTSAGASSSPGMSGSVGGGAGGMGGGSW